MIGIIDYNIGNIGSIKNMLYRVGHPTSYESFPENIKKYDRIILPGIGKFDYGMTQLSEKGLKDAICEFAHGGKPILGICLGMQLLFEGSEEGKDPGLSLLPGRFQQFSLKKKEFPVPHMGWGHVKCTSGRLGTGWKRFYFVHSFYLPMENPYSSGQSEYGVKFSAMIEKDNVFGVQFHPEKSHRYGMELLKQFAEIRL